MQTKERTNQSHFSPEEIIINAFLFLNASEIDEASVIKICLAANCPGETIAKRVLKRMLDQKQLTVRVDENSGLKMYAPYPHPATKARLN